MEEKILYRAQITHTEKTIERLYKTQYYAYDKLRVLLRIALGLALAVAAILLSIPTWAKVLLLLLGTWLFASGDFPAAVRADRALSERKAELPHMQYAFGADCVRLEGEGSMDIPYKNFTRLTEDTDYLYLFVTRDSVCMLERASISPPPDTELMQFLAEKTGLAWRREKGFLSMNFYDILQIIRDARGKE